MITLTEQKSITPTLILQLDFLPNRFCSVYLTDVMQIMTFLAKQKLLVSFNHEVSLWFPSSRYKTLLTSGWEHVQSPFIPRSHDPAASQVFIMMLTWGGPAPFSFSISSVVLSGEVGVLLIYSPNFFYFLFLKWPAQQRMSALLQQWRVRSSDTTLAYLVHPKIGL